MGQSCDPLTIMARDLLGPLLAPPPELMARLCCGWSEARGRCRLDSA